MLVLPIPGPRNAGRSRRAADPVDVEVAEPVDLDAAHEPEVDAALGGDEEVVEVEDRLALAVRLGIDRAPRRGSAGSGWPRPPSRASGSARASASARRIAASGIVAASPHEPISPSAMSRARKTARSSSTVGSTHRLPQSLLGRGAADRGVVRSLVRRAEDVRLHVLLVRGRVAAPPRLGGAGVGTEVLVVGLVLGARGRMRAERGLDDAGRRGAPGSSCGPGRSAPRRSRRCARPARSTRFAARASITSSTRPRGWRTLPNSSASSTWRTATSGRHRAHGAVRVALRVGRAPRRSRGRRRCPCPRGRGSGGRDGRRRRRGRRR